MQLIYIHKLETSYYYIFSIYNINIYNLKNISKISILPVIQHESCKLFLNYIYTGIYRYKFSINET